MLLLKNEQTDRLTISNCRHPWTAKRVVTSASTTLRKEENGKEKEMGI